MSDELCRTAITLKEQWHSAIEEACRLYFQEKNIQGMIKTLMTLHDLMRKEPQTLSEIAFHQSFGLELAEAEAWLKRFINGKDEFAISQAWNIYKTFYDKNRDAIETLSKVFLENVSPKLLNTKNTELVMPGMYDPKRPQIFITGFAPTLSVLNSK